MILGIACTITISVIALWLRREVVHWNLVSKILGRDLAIEKAKRQAIAMALSDLSKGLAHNDPTLCAQATRAALRLANDDTDETLLLLGFKLPEKIA